MIWCLHHIKKEEVIDPRKGLRKRKKCKII